MVMIFAVLIIRKLRFWHSSFDKRCDLVEYNCKLTRIKYHNYDIGSLPTLWQTSAESDLSLAHTWFKPWLDGPQTPTSVYWGTWCGWCNKNLHGKCPLMGLDTWNAILSARNKPCPNVQERMQNDFADMQVPMSMPLYTSLWNAYSFKLASLLY
jgi:hypothetical protein